MMTIGKGVQDVFLRGKIFEPECDENGVCYEHLQLGSKFDLEDVIFSTGGNATNAAATFARQGLHSSYMWILGNDVGSNIIIQALDDENVDTSAVAQRDEYTASYSTILLAPNGERTILNYHGSMVGSDGYPLDLGRLKQADWLYISSVGSMELLEKIISVAHEGNVKVALNPAAPELAKPAKLKALLEDVELLSVNVDEAKLLFEGESAEELARHATHFCPYVVVSDGPNGAVATDSKKVVIAGMYEDVPVVDRTGAGDAFGSGFVTKIALGKSIEQAVTFASANSTSVVQKIGAKEGILHAHAEIHEMPLEVKDF